MVSGLDGVTGSLIIRNIVHQAGTTIVMIEHIVEVILRLSGRVLVLNFGQKLFEGTPREVVEHPAVVESYLGRKLDAVEP